MFVGMSNVEYKCQVDENNKAASREHVAITFSFLCLQRPARPGNRVALVALGWHRAAESAHACVLGQHHLVLPRFPWMLGCVEAPSYYCFVHVCVFVGGSWSRLVLVADPGWFALAPLGLEVATSMGTCENQLFPPKENPKRPAYLKFKNLKTGLAYCQYGVVKQDGKPTDCEEVPPGAATEEEQQKYRPEVLASCVCTPGTECKSVIGNAGVASGLVSAFFHFYRPGPHPSGNPMKPMCISFLHSPQTKPRHPWHLPFLSALPWALCWNDLAR